MRLGKDGWRGDELRGARGQGAVDQETIERRAREQGDDSDEDERTDGRSHTRTSVAGARRLRRCAASKRSMPPSR